MEYLFIGAVVIGLLIMYSARVTSRTRAWVIRIRAGVPFLVKGKIPANVVAEFTEVLQRHGIRRGALYGLRRQGAIVLGFSRNIPEPCRQGLRNVCAMHAR